MPDFKKLEEVLKKFAPSSLHEDIHKVFNPEDEAPKTDEAPKEDTGNASE